MEGAYLIEKMKLDAPEMDTLRKDIFNRIKVALKLGLDDPDARALLKNCLGYPDNLPDLSKEPLPPDGNQRPEGLSNSFFEQNKRPGGLPEYY